MTDHELDEELRAAGEYLDRRSIAYVAANSTITPRPVALRLLVGGAIAIVALVAVTISLQTVRSDVNSVETEPAAGSSATRSGAATEPTAASPTGGPSTSLGVLTCGAEFPFSVDFPAMGVPLVVGPLPDSLPADEGQLIGHLVAADSSVEIRWPASQRALRGDAATNTVQASVGEYIYDDSVVHLFINEESEVLVGGPGDTEPFARFTNLEYSGSDPACSTFEMRIVDDAGTASMLIALDRPGDDEFTGGWVDDNDPVVVKTSEVETGPIEAVPCEGGVGDVPPNVDRPIRSGPVASTPVDALVMFLDEPEAGGLAGSGYLEFLEADGSVTYARPVKPGSDDFVTIVRVEATEGGWTATHLTASGC